MTEEQIEDLKKSIDHQLKIGIEEHVNGKIRQLTAKFNAYVEKDEEWKDRAEPAIMMVQNVQGFGKVALYGIGFISAVSGLALLLSKFFKQ